MTRRRILAIVSVLLIAVLVAAYWRSGGTTLPRFKILKTIPLGGDGKWDYLCVDPEVHRLFVTRSTGVQVVDLDNDILAQTIDYAGTSRVHGVALVPEQNRGFITAGKDGWVTVFDLSTLKITGKVKTSGSPDCIVYDPASHHVFANHKNGDITVIDPAALDKTSTIKLEGKLEAGIPDGAGHLFVCILDKNEIVQIDTLSNSVVSHWPLGSGQSPTGLAIDIQHMRLFAGCGNQQLVILDANTGTILGTTAIGKFVDGVAFDPTLQLIMTSNGDGTVSVVKETSPGKFETIQTIKTTTGAETITLDPKTHQFLLPSNVPNGSGGMTFGIIVLGLDTGK